MTPTDTKLTSPLISGLDRALQVVDDEIRQIESADTGATTPIRGAEAGGADANKLADLEEFAHRLKQIKSWMEQDNDLLKVVDSHIGEQVKLIDQKQSWREIRLAIVTTAAGVILGWLFSSAATPVQLWRMLMH